MPRARDNYQVSGNTVAELVTSLNFLLQRFADRIDRMEGIRGDASIESNLDMNSNQITEVAGGSAEDSADDDAARLADLTSQVDEAIASHVAETDPHTQYARNTQTETISGAWTHTADLTMKADVKVYDAANNLIHSLE
jgi:hypothetical protein